MSAVQISTSARLDLAGAVRVLGNKSKSAARRFTGQFVRKATKYAEQPLLGIRRDDLRSGMHCLLIMKYVVYYFKTDQGIEVAHVFHGARDIDSDHFS